MGFLEGLNYIDIALTILILLLGAKGFFNGFVKELCGLIGIIGGVYAAFLYKDGVGNWISNTIWNFTNEALTSIIGFVVVLGAIWIGMVIISEMILKLVRASALSTVDRLLGVVFASIKIFMVIAVIVFAFSMIEFTRTSMERYTQNSKLYPVLLKAGSWVVHTEPIQQMTKNAEESINSVTENQPK
ncbi:hypothetical protein CCZ01_08275 [Helicobacter monodelphidis]|uniref:CvpA family protein n=1 Tax=Helicobacter sp. 15-1451 TaxID=2004995 RepID=UPI000DCECB78|nr:CvpA family protein [Helicobacter sp. 15-1451]RAX56844.1 hypothetical protein CCZ01_08275 [Helicobacter sp. 15-1451]